MCLDQDATFDALEVEQPVEQSCCKLTRRARLHLCPHYDACGYQRQKEAARAAQVIVCAHDSLFHIKPEAIGDVGLLVIDEGFWQSGLRGLDGKAVLTLDGLEPGSVTCWKKGKRRCRGDGRPDRRAPAGSGRRCRAPSPARSPAGAPQAVGLTPDDCRNAATLERRRCATPACCRAWTVERAKRIARVLPPPASPGRRRAAARSVADPRRGDRERPRRRRGRVSATSSPRRHGAGADAPLAHPAPWRLGRVRARAAPGRHHAAELVRPYLPRLAPAPPVSADHAARPGPPDARQPDERQGADARMPRRPTASTSRGAHLRDLHGLHRAPRPRVRRHRDDADVLVIGQKAAIDHCAMPACRPGSTPCTSTR